MANLLIVSGYWPSRDNPISGIFIVEQIRAFTELGHKVWVVVGQAIGRRKELLSLAELGLDEEAVVLLSPRFIRAPEKLSHHAFFFRQNIQNTGGYIARSIKQINASGIRLNGALVHGMRYSVPSAPIWKPRLNAPAVAMIHGVDPLLNERPIDVSIVEQIKSGLSHFDEVGIVGSFLREFLDTLGLDHERFRVLLNGTEIPSERTSGIDNPSDTKLPKRILSVSRLCDWKGVDDTLRALRQLRQVTGRTDWQLRVVGDGPEMAALKKLTVTLGIEGNVYFAGRLNRKATLAEFDQCDLFCLPSWAEAFGIVYLEAMARARPIIGCNNCGPADFVTSAHDGILVPMKSPSSVADALSMLWDDPDQLNAIGAAGRKTAEMLTWRRNAIQICDLLEVS